MPEKKSPFHCIWVITGKKQTSGKEKLALSHSQPRKDIQQHHPQEKIVEMIKDAQGVLRFVQQPQKPLISLVSHIPKDAGSGYTAKEGCNPALLSTFTFCIINSSA